MKLRALEVEQFRKFDRAIRLENFGDGVNVLCGPNEFGKSTILAAIRGLLFERHNSRADPIKRMQTWRGNAAPRLAMDFDIGPSRWRIEKRFLSQPSARLTGPDGSRFENDAAEEELQRLLGFGASGNKGAKLENMGMWGALWVTQRDSVAQADLSHDLARSTITACLDAEVGVLTGHESGQSLLRAVRDQRAQFLDGNNRPKGRYKDVTQSLEALASKLQDLHTRAQRLTEDAEDLRRSEDQLTRESDPAAEQRDREALNRARALREAALIYAERVQNARAAVHRAARDVAEAEAELKHRQARAVDLAQAEKAAAAHLAQLRQARDEEAAAESAYTAARSALEAANTRAATARAALRHAREIQALTGQTRRLADYEAALTTAEAEQAIVTQLAARLETLPITKARLEAVRAAAREQQTAMAVLTAQATVLAFDLLPDAAASISIDGGQLEANPAPRALIDATKIRIEGIGTLHITPAIQDREKLQRRADRARETLQAALQEAGAASEAEAEARFTEREALERKLADSRAAVQRATPGNKTENLAPGIGPLRDHAAKLRQILASANAALNVPATADTIDPDAADREDNAAHENLEHARRQADATAEARLNHRNETARAEAAARAAQHEIARLTQQAEAAESLESTEALATRAAEARQTHEHLAGNLALLERDQPADTADAMSARIARYEQALTQRQQNVRRLREHIAALRAGIAREGGHGLDEQIATAERDHAALTLEHQTIQRETKILQLLLETLTSAERETKERYLAPVSRRVTPYLRSLFPGADITCDDALRITGVTRGGGGAEDFERLSDGTQEQIAVLARLAFAEMLTDQGKPAMVILDDALAYSDADRMERMFDILTQAAAKTQILVFTCREDIFARLGGNRLHLAHPAAPILEQSCT
jgi:DNA repair exonuclease SbcCD ATPase subunit